MTILHYVLLALAILCFIVAAINVSHPKLNFGWLGLAFFAGAFWFR